MKHVFERAGNMVAKGKKNACYQNFLNIPQCFENATSSGKIKAGLVE